MCIIKLLLCLYLLFRWELGNQVVQCLSSKVGTFLDYTYQGAGFVFNYLASGKPFQPDLYNNTDEALTDTVRTILGEINDQGVVPLPFFFGPLSIVYFVSFFVSMLYYWGTLQFIVKKIGTQYSRTEREPALKYFHPQVGSSTSLWAPRQPSL